MIRTFYYTILSIKLDIVYISLTIIVDFPDISLIRMRLGKNSQTQFNIQIMLSFINESHMFNFW